MAFVLDYIKGKWEGNVKDYDKKDLDSWNTFIDGAERDRQREWVVDGACCGVDQLSARLLAPFLSLACCFCLSTVASWAGRTGCRPTTLQ